MCASIIHGSQCTNYIYNPELLPLYCIIMTHLKQTIQLLALAFYLRLPLSFFLENKREREAVRVGGCWLRESDGRKQQRPYTSAETLPEMLGTHCCHLPLRVWVCCKQQPSPNMSAVGSVSGRILLTQPSCNNLIQKKAAFTHTHTHESCSVLC